MVILLPGACKKKGHELKERILDRVKTDQKLSSSMIALASCPEDVKDNEGFAALLENLLKEDLPEESINR